jgi:hypothetical protein
LLRELAENESPQRNDPLRRREPLQDVRKKASKVQNGIPKIPQTKLEPIPKAKKATSNKRKKRHKEKILLVNNIIIQRKELKHVRQKNIRRF